MQTTTIYMFGFSKETPHLDGSFEYTKEIQMSFFFQHSQTYLAYWYIQSLESNNQPIKSRLLVNPEARFLVLGTCSCSYSSLRWSCFLIIWRRKQSRQPVVLVIVFRATSNAQSWCNMRNMPGRRQSIFDLRLSIVLTFSIAAYPVFVVFFCCFTPHVNSYSHCGTVSSLNHTFSWAGLSKRLTSNLCTYFRL